MRGPAQMSEESCGIEVLGAGSSCELVANGTESQL